MNARTRRIGAVSTSLAAVALVVGGTLGIANAVGATPEPTPTPAVVMVPAEPYVNPDTIERQIAADREAERIEAERVAAEAAAAEAARVEAERVSAEQAAADQAARDAAARQAPAAPAAPAPAEPGGNQQAGECREYNDANECTAYYVP